MGVWLVFKDAPHAELAADLLAKYSFDTEFRKTVFDLQGIIPPTESGRTDEYFANHPYFGPDMRDVYFEALEYLSAYPYTPTFSTEQTIVMSYLDQYCEGSLTLDEALQGAQDDLINQIGNAYY